MARFQEFKLWHTKELHCLDLDKVLSFTKQGPQTIEVRMLGDTSENGGLYLEISYKDFYKKLVDNWT
jgi:hypothetical protein